MAGMMRPSPLLLLNSLTGSDMVISRLLRCRIMPVTWQSSHKTCAPWRKLPTLSALWYKVGNILHRTNHIMKIESVEAPKTSIQVIERMVALLDALANYTDPVSLKELSKVSGLHPSTAHRILNDMVITRFVDRVEPGTYRLGMRLLELGNVVKSRLSVREAALDFMRALHKKTQQTINLSVRQGDEIVYIDRAFSERSGMQVVRAIGGRGPLHLTSTGTLLLSIDEPKAIRPYATRK